MKTKNIQKGSGTQINVGKNNGIIINGNNDKDSNPNNSFWDKIMKLPFALKFIISILIIFIVVLVFVLLNKGFTVETPMIKIIPPKDTMRVIDNKDERHQNSIETTITKNTNDMDFLKKKNTEKTENLNSGSGTQINIEKNEGIVASNSTFNINTELPPRNLKDPNIQRELENFINQFLRDHNRDKSCPIKVRVDHTSQEARNYAKEIFDYLKSKNYNVKGIVNLEIFSPEIRQTEVIYEKNLLYEDEDSTVHIKVGLNKPR